MIRAIRTELLRMGQYGSQWSARLVQIGRDERGRPAPWPECGHVHRSESAARGCARKHGWPEPEPGDPCPGCGDTEPREDCICTPLQNRVIRNRAGAMAGRTAPRTTPSWFTRAVRSTNRVVMRHEVEVLQSPGWWPSLVEARCSCGWRGPTRDMNEARQRRLVKLDQCPHAQPGDR